MKKIFTAFVLSMAVFATSPAQAASYLTAGGGVSFGSGEAHKGFAKSAPFFTGEYTFGAGDVLQLGPFFDYTLLSSDGAPGSTSGSVLFYGATVRIGFEYLTNLFFDGKLGLTQTSVGSASSDTVFGFGIGVGYTIDLPEAPILIRPHLGYRNLPNNSGVQTRGRNFLDLGVLVSFEL